MERTCEVCQKKFDRRGTRKAPTCDLACRAIYISRIQAGKERVKKGTIFKCKTCGRDSYSNPSRTNRTKYCSMKCRNGDKTYWMRISGSGHYGWKGGRLNTPGGYVYITQKDHPRAIKAGYVLEHRLVMEKHLGRHLERDEEVHHRNGIKNDNRIENLELVKRNMHYGKVKCPHCLKEFLVK